MPALRLDRLAKTFHARPKAAGGWKRLTGLMRAAPPIAVTAVAGVSFSIEACEIAAALLHAPKILFLDEPTIGLDVTAKAALRDHLNELARADGTTVVLTSHDTGDIEKICERAIVIDHGRLIMDSSLAELRRA